MINHIHLWKSEVVEDLIGNLVFTGNLVCSCGEIIWRDEVVAIINMCKTDERFRLFSLRGR